MIYPNQRPAFPTGGGSLYTRYQSIRLRIHLECSNDLVEKLLANCSRLARAHGSHVSTDHISTIVRLQVISDLLCPGREFTGLCVLIITGLGRHVRVKLCYLSCPGRSSGFVQKHDQVDVAVRGWKIIKLVVSIYLQQGDC